MFGLKKSPLKFGKHNTVDPVYPNPSRTNPFDSDDEIETKPKHNSSRRTSSEPTLFVPESSTNPFDDDDQGRGTTSSLYSHSSTLAARNKYKNDFRDSGGLENQSVQELEDYAVYKAEETTKSVNNCLKIAEDMREDATKTLVLLHHQGEQITRTHTVAADIDYDLSRGEKLLGSLGGIFSKTWKPKKTRQIKGPVIVGDDVQRKVAHMEQREKLGLAPLPKARTKAQTLHPEPTDAYQKVEVEKAKQDDALSDLSNMLGELKDMAVDMGTEIERHNKALDHMYDDVDELNYRVRGANERGRRLLGK
ncbi:SNAP25-like protein [Morus notabilis]|uniref:SNAP25-like protein n=1 Tax=Morus notabilis TaxID=981085 RepID=W9RUV3_9ROSA|nr:SNAP25 homologous protein SNAP33 [Morus notabilis]XP_024028161.1 SNAP25 homologous protein SNAP33 [Morus notabilis]EXC11032.1 SNAP25-like protein [Morus notabilis]